MRRGILTGVGLTLLVGFEAAGSLAAPSPEALTQALGAEDVRVRRYAAWALGREASGAGVSELVRALDDPDDLVARYAGDSLGAIGVAAVEPLLSALDRCSRCGREGERVLAAIGEPALPLLVPRLGEATPSATRRSTARVLGQMGPSAANAVPALLEALELPSDRADRVEIATALGKIGASAVSPVLARLEREPPSDLRELLFRALGSIGPPSRAALPILIESLRTGDGPAVRYRAALALGAIGDEAAAPALLACLQNDPSATVRMYAALALGDVPGDTAHSVPALVAILGSGDSQVAPRAATALAKIGQAAVPRLLAALDDGNEDARGWAASTLGRIESARAAAGPRLVETFADPSERVRDQALQAIVEIGDSATPWLLAALGGHANPVVRSHAALALGKLEPPPLDAVPPLADALGDPDPHVRELACWSLGRFGPDAAKVIPALLDALASDDPLLRRNAVWALGNIGPSAAARSEAAVVAMHDDPDPAVREEAAESLEKLRGSYVWKN